MAHADSAIPAGWGRGNLEAAEGKSDLIDGRIEARRDILLSEGAMG
jgi:hypothetical protein